MKRKNPLENNQIYHVYTRSIADFKIFNNNSEYQRMINLLYFFQVEEPPTKFSEFLALEKVQKDGFMNCFNLMTPDQEKIVEIVAYCLMPTHLHLLLRQLKKAGISQFVGNVLNGYSRHFNLKHKRKGPLWEGKFQNKLVDNDDLLIHIIRYIHLNPVTSHLVERPEDWDYSSHREFISPDKIKFPMCQYDTLLDIKPIQFKKFVDDRISYQRELQKIKNLII